MDWGGFVADASPGVAALLALLGLLAARVALLNARDDKRIKELERRGRR